MTARGYTPGGKRASVRDARGTTVYTYDSRGRLARVTNPDGSALAYAYDASGRRTSLTAIVGGREYTTTYAYDAASRVSGLVDANGRPYALEFNAVGERTMVRLPNGVVTRFSRDARDRLTSLQTRRADGTLLQAFTYTQGAAGERLRVDEADGTSRAFTYDALQRLLGERVITPAGVSTERTFGYDAVGNRVGGTDSEAPGEGVLVARFDARDRLLRQGDITYAWDADGHLVSRTGPKAATLDWGYGERLRAVTLADGTRVEHLYDVDGNLVETRTTPPGGTARVSRKLVDPTGELSHVVAELDESGELVALYTRVGDDLLSVTRPGGTRFVHTDGLGSVRGLSNESGALTDTWSYDAWGELSGRTGSDANPYLFAGEPRDPTTGFAYHRARWMDPETGRFLSVDPAPGRPEAPLSYHRYAYAHADPVNNVDPTGQFVGLAASPVLAISVAPPCPSPWWRRRPRCTRASSVRARGATTSGSESTGRASRRRTRNW
jgi:RHS repeat-associated protein